MGIERPGDRELGMHRRITRRDFLDGVLIGAGAVVAGGWLAACTADGSPITTSGATASGTGIGGLVTPALPAYPPALTGLRGQIDTAAAVPHMLRDGTFWDAAGAAQDTGETYDLVIVGGGISGLSAAYFAQQRDPNARILILDNHDDFGGHARRNEFTDVQGRDGGLLIGYGGTEAIETPSVYSSAAMGLLLDLGIDVQRFHEFYDNGFWADLHELFFFGAEQWGRDHVAIRGAGQAPAEYLRGAPMASAAIRDFDTLVTAPTDYWSGRSAADKERRLAATTYAAYLRDVAKVHPDVVSFLSTRSSDWWGYGIDGVGAIDAWASGYPGFDGLGLSLAAPSRFNSITIKREWDATDPYIFHFPEGNAAIARMLVRRLVPGSMPGSTMEDEVLATMDYGTLDAEANPVRIRLGSPVVKVAHVGDPSTAAQVEVTYVRDGALHTVRGGGAVMACWYTMVPYLVDGLPRTAGRRGALDEPDPARLRDGPGAHPRGVPQARHVGRRRRRHRRRVGLGVPRLSGQHGRLRLPDGPRGAGPASHDGDPDRRGHVAARGREARPRRHARPAVRGLRAQHSLLRGRRARRRRLRSRERHPGDHRQPMGARVLVRIRDAVGRRLLPPRSAPRRGGGRPFGRITFANTDRSSRAYTDSAIDAAFAAVHEQPD